MDEKIFALGVEQEPSKNNESKVRQKILLETKYGIEDYSMKEIENSLIKMEDSSLEKNNHPPEIFDKISDQEPEKENEFTRDAPELTRQSETDPVSKIKNQVPKNNIEKLNNTPKNKSSSRSIDIKLKEEQINIEWNHLSNAIQEAANKHIPWSKAKKTDFSYKKVFPKCKYHKELKLLHKICKDKKEKGVAKINYSEHNELYKWANLLRKKAEILARNIKKKEIQTNKIKIDRVLKEEKNFYQNSELVIKKTEIKKCEKEWLAALNKAHNKIVLGVSEIVYILLKKVSVETTKEFIKFANMVLEEGKFPRK
ncbi:1156_t:CDS:2 [Gigaspora margarita]|uniref:1156_t:CDS:1 n=1 Tax=Gigaspora margarita TaxID=4874 RepID=A0ABN7VAB0_GIGMA|nr:1156_t:CDS:2 [Gigaspora margarita]